MRLQFKNNNILKNGSSIVGAENEAFESHKIGSTVIPVMIYKFESLTPFSNSGGGGSSGGSIDLDSWDDLKVGNQTITQYIVELINKYSLWEIDSDGNLVPKV